MNGDVVGKTLLVGITYLDEDGEPTDQVQHHGRIVRFDQEVVELETADGERLTFPPEIDEAPPEEYRLRATGEVVVDPDFLASWSVHQPAETAE